MSNGRSTTDLLRFLDYLAEKGLMPSATAASRKASANKMLAVLSAEESVDVTVLDMDDVALRFHNKNGKQYTPGSIQTYKSRVSSAIEDFRSYLNNPLGFRSSSKPRQRMKSVKEKTEVKNLVVLEPTSSDEQPQYQNVALRFLVLAHKGPERNDFDFVNCGREFEFLRLEDPSQSVY